MRSEFYWECGPLLILRCGKVWAVDLWRLRLYGVGWRAWRFAIVRG
jgi:hypothetical protein